MHLHVTVTDVAQEAKLMAESFEADSLHLVVRGILLAIPSREEEARSTCWDCTYSVYSDRIRIALYSNTAIGSAIQC